MKKKKKKTPIKYDFLKILKFSQIENIHNHTHAILNT